ncbi:kelch-like protein 22 isoform X1 [Gadus macrocephalus]|uniref:kelch-like protein 22 isoform X1 n=1 Tax=Gadus macrocephalus TaxID=80720 RepID=UPI0028CB71A2|nr:kelch-like protein 22 isoform X1 [Gadus macrocephalus]
MAEARQLSPLAGRADVAGPSSRQTYASSAHYGTVMSGLHDLRQSGILFDVVLLAEGRPIKAHRILLAAACDYFRELFHPRGMFAGGLREAQQTEIAVHGVTYTALSKLLDFIYTSEIELDLDNVQEVLIAATLVQIGEVISFCCDFLFSWLDESNILEVHKLADMFGLQQLETKIHAYILQNIQTLSRTAAYRQLPPDKVLQVLSSEELEVLSENEVYEAALHYHYSPEQVETDQVCLQDNLKMLEAVRFCLMERPVLQRLYGRLDACPLKESVAAALRYHEQEVLQPVLQGPRTQPRSNARCVLGFGGMYANSGATSDTEGLFQVFHPSWGEWRTLGAAQAPHMSNQGVAVLNNFVYLVGGDKNTSGFRAETRCWRYDPRHNSWCCIQPLLQQRADHSVCVLGEHIYAIGGRDYRNELDSVERYDPHTNTWECVAPLKREVYAHAGAVLDGRIYVTCGRRGLAYLRETYCFDPATDQWAACAEGPVERAWHGVAARGGRLYVIGGSNDEHSYRRDVLKVACFDPQADSWSLVSPLPAGHGEPGLAVLDARIYVLGGRSHNKGNRMRYVHVYDADLDQWEVGTPFEGRVSGLAACVLPLPRAVMAQARGWQQHIKRASWADAPMEHSEYSSDD